VQECVKSIAKDGLIKLGQHGGYIDPYDTDLSLRELNINLREPTESDAVSLTQGSDVPVVYWWNMYTNNQCQEGVTCTATNRNWPRLEYIEGQLNRYITRELDSCLADFRSFREQGFDIEKLADTAVETTVTKANVLFKVTYPIEISKEEQSIKVATYRESLNVNFREIYDLAYAIMAFEGAYQFLEVLVLDFISVYSGVDINKMPPIGYSDNNFYTVSWPFDLVQKNLKDKLMFFIQLINIEGTKGAQKLTGTNSMAQSIYDKLFIDVTTTDRTFPDLRTNFLYLNWPIYFNIRPRSGKTISPDVTEEDFPAFSDYFIPGPRIRNNEYSFFYDVGFPVIIKITDDKAFGNEGYTFFFALEGNVRKNSNLLRFRSDGPSIVPGEVPLIDPQGNTMEDAPKKIFCNSMHQIVPVKITTYDARTFAPLEDVSVIYGCGTFKSCPIGQSKYYDNDNSAYFEGKFPICHGGYLLLKKEGYLNKAIPLSTLNPLVTEQVSVPIQPIREKTATIVPYKMSAPGSCCSASTLEAGESVMLTVNKIVASDDPFDHNLDSIMVFDADNLEQEIKLVPGRYEITGFFFSDNIYNISPYSNHICEGDSTDDWWNPATNTPTSQCHGVDCPVPGDGEECDAWVGGVHFDCCEDANVFYPEQDVEMNLMGGITIKESNGGAWPVYKGELDSSDIIEFHVIVPAPATCIAYENCIRTPAIGLEEMGRVDEYSVTFRNYALPSYR
jgi:hypothetical protein